MCFTLGLMGFCMVKCAVSGDVLIYCNACGACVFEHAKFVIH